MVVLHLDWSGGQPRLWGEGAFRNNATPGVNPYSLTMRRLLLVAQEVMWYRQGFEGGSPVEVRIPTIASKPIPAYTQQIDGADEAAWKVESIIPCASNLLMFLSDVKERKLADGIFLAPSVLKAASLFRFASYLATNGHYLPVIRFENNSAMARWRPVLTAPESLRLRKLAVTVTDVAFFEWIVDRLIRHSAMTLVSRRLSEHDKFISVHDAWLAALRTEDGKIPWEDSQEVRAFAEDLEAWRESLNETPEERAELKFRLVAPAREDGQWKIVVDSVRMTRRRLLALGQAALLFPPLRSLRSDGDAQSAALNLAEVDAFIHTGMHALEAGGYVVSVPEGLIGEHITAAVEVTPLENATPSSPITSKLTIRVAGQIVDEQEIMFLLDQNSPIVYFRDQWIEVDRNILKEALRAIRGLKKNKMKLADAVAFSVGLGRAGNLKVEELKAHGWLRGLLNELSGKHEFEALQTPGGFNGELKPFQIRGFSWMAFLCRWGFGACLADDMGLGKTIQTIALILHLRSEMKGRPALVVAPLTVLGNWSHEFKRFAPSLKILAHHGASRMAGFSFVKTVSDCDVVLTSYNLLVKDYRDISAVEFSLVVIDEAQTIKNASTRTAQAVRSLDAPMRVALTGTPLENSVNDLWSLEAFLNPGLLGSREDFATAFALPIMGDAHGGALKRLKRALEPFILRRLKTDPAIDVELGDKRETREYCPLTAVQRRLYEDAVYGFQDSASAEESAFARRGRVLALLTRLKEICDSPALIPDSEERLPVDSGKLLRLEELLTEIFANGESALVFTQYARMGNLLQERLLEKFGRTMPFLHGSLDVRMREAEIRRFNESSEPLAFILSLRAGGFGLNLVKATHVIHFDRWWNPAVEAQATDRAYRIGQTRTVHVHTFICSGTVEDRVDQLLEEKKQLAAGVITNGENFLASMSDEELVKIVELEK